MSSASSTTTTTTTSQPITLVYGVPWGCSFASIIALEWSGVPYQLIRHEMAAEKSEAFNKVSPYGQTPIAILESGLVLQEAIAILSNIGARDLSKKIAGKQGTEEYDKINVALSFLSSTVHPAIK
jgi:glutathione S-transferase